VVQYKEPRQRFAFAATHRRGLKPAGHQNVDRVIRQECSAKQLALSANGPTCGGGDLRVYEEAVPALNIIIIIIIIIIINIFYMRHNIICGTNYKYRTAAPLYTQETWIVSGKYPLNVINVIIIIIIINTFYMRHKIICGTNYKYRTAAPLYTQETWIVSGKYPLQLINVIIRLIIIIINTFYMRHNIICGTNYKYRIAAPLYTQETWIVSGKYPLNVINVIIIIIIINTFYMRHNIICGTNYKYRIAAPLYTQ